MSTYKHTMYNINTYTKTQRTVVTIIIETPLPRSDLIKQEKLRKKTFIFNRHTHTVKDFTYKN